MHYSARIVHRLQDAETNQKASQTRTVAREGRQGTLPPTPPARDRPEKQRPCTEQRQRWWFSSRHTQLWGPPGLPPETWISVRMMATKRDGRGPR